MKERREGGRAEFEVSSGGVVVRQVGAGHEALLIGRGKPRVWRLPKGHVESGESYEETAVREVHEETGCYSNVVVKLSKIKYNFFQGGTMHRKTVHFYLMQYLSTATRCTDYEVEEARWFELSEALDALKFFNEKRMMALAIAYLGEPRDGTFAYPV